MEERDELLRSAVPEDPSVPSSRRYNVRRTAQGLETYDAKCHQIIDGEPEFHAHPAGRIPGRILRRFRDEGRISQPEYKKLLKEFGGC